MLLNVPELATNDDQLPTSYDGNARYLSLSYRIPDGLSLISSETLLSVRSKRSKGCTHTREMIMVAAVSFMIARTRLRVGLASTPKRSLLELFCSRALWARAQ